MELKTSTKPQRHLQALLKSIEAFRESNRPQSIQPIFDTLRKNQGLLKAHLSLSGSKPLFEVGQRLLQARTKPETLFDFLDLARANLLLEKVNDEGGQNRWFALLLRIIEAADFTVGRLFVQRAKAYGPKTVLKILKGNRQKKITWTELQEMVFTVAKALLAALPKNRRGCEVAILSENRLEMAVIDIACLCTGIVNVLIPANSVDDQIEYILHETKAHIAFVSDRSLLTKILNCQGVFKYLQHIVLMDSGETFSDQRIETLRIFLQRAERSTEDDVLHAIHNVKSDDLATLMYTSGTTHDPKGIQFSQLNLVSKRFARAIALPEIGEDDVFLCYLPLFHTFGRFFEMLGCLFWGATYVFMESPKQDTMIESFKRSKPTVFISIPKKWGQLFESIRASVDIDTEAPEKIRAKIHEVTGGRLKWGLSAAGYLDPEVFRFFQIHGVELMSGFGMTEATGGITMTPPNNYKDNSVGQALPGIDIKLASDGEMLLRGPYVMLGYFGKDSGLRKGWLKTGDIFSKDQDGHFWILDRKKDIYKNVQGETIAPQKIENLFLEFETVSQVFLVGDNRPYNTVLLYPNYDYEQAELAMMSPKERRDFFHSHVVWVNQFLAPYERVVDFTIIPRRFQKEQGELTQKGTFKRKCVVANFRNDIERMYKTDYVTRRLAGREFRIPNWFLREHGFLPDDVIQTQKGITIGAKRAKLHIRADEKNNRRFKLGSFFYRCLANHIDFSEFISRPELWVGNLKLVRFLGVKMFSIEGKTAPAEIEMVDKEIELSKAQEETLSRQFAHSLKQQNPVQAIHKAAFILATEHKALSAKAFKYLDSVLQRQQNNHKASHLIYTILKRKACSHNREIKSAAFQTLLCHTQGDDLKQILELFFKNDCTFLDQKTASQICAVNFSDQHLSTLFSLMTHLQTDASVAHSNEQLRILLNLITEIGIRHPTKYKAIRVELFKWSNIHNQQLASEANACLRQLMLKFREWLGPNQQIAVNPDNAEEFRWRDVITFDENIKPKDCDIIMGALREHPVLQEAIFLFCGRIQIRLQDIAQKGIWISFLGQSTKRARFRVSVHTRYQGSFDFTLTINKEKSTGSLNQELVWMIYVRAKSSYLPLVKDFGGYWPRFNIWTEEYIPGKTIEKFLTRLERRQDPEQRERMRERWLNFAWSGMCAYVDFWNRTERQVEITEPITKNVIIPPEDYQVGYRIVSITKRRRHKNILDLLFRLKAQFLEVVEARYPGLKGRCQWPVIFSAFLEILGEKDGVTLLRAAYKSLSRVKKTPGVKALQLSFERYFRAINETGFLPRRLYFAIKRYHRWHALNPSATQVARIQTLIELYNTYSLQNLEQSYPGVRVQFFRETVFSKSKASLKNSLSDIIRTFRNKDAENEILVHVLSEISTHTKLNKDEELFLTRMTFPHLTPHHSAKLISLPEGGAYKPNLVVFMEDFEGNTHSIRNPASPKEIGRLYRLFKIAKLPVDFLPEHQYLVVLNERLHVIAGLFYRFIKNDHVHMEKIVVDERYRKKGISEGLLNEFFNRLQSLGVGIVTVGFLRPQFFYRFGFQLDRSYGNMVKKLDNLEKEELPKERTVPPVIAEIS